MDLVVAGIELYLQDERLIIIKDKGKRLLMEDDELWTKRPLTDDLIQYCIDTDRHCGRQAPLVRRILSHATCKHNILNHPYVGTSSN